MRKILLADDHPDIVKLLELSLKEEGYTILKAYDGAETLRKIEEERPDIIILDVVMPPPDGYRVLHHVKSDPALRDTVVVMLTVRDEPEDTTLGLDIGADFYLGKPFRPGDVVSLIRRIFDAREFSTQRGTEGIDRHS